MKRFIRAVLPAFLLAVSVGQIYAFTNFSTEIAQYIGETQKNVQFAFSLGIFFLGMGAAFFGKIVEKNIRLSTIIGTTLFLSGLLVTEAGIHMKSLAMIYLGYGFLIGLGTGVIYISPVKTMMLWFPEHKAIAAALPIISFGLGSTLSTILFSGIHWGTPGSSVAVFQLRGFMDYGITNVFHAYAIFYAVPMVIACFLLKKPKIQVQSFGHGIPSLEFSYMQLFGNRFFWQSWLFMFLNISAGLCLIPLAKQMMSSPDVYGDNVKLITWIVALWAHERRRQVPLRVVVRPPRKAHQHPSHHPRDFGRHNARELLASTDRPCAARHQRLLRRGLLGDPRDSRRPLRHDEHLEDSRRSSFCLGLRGACGQPGGDGRFQGVRRL